MTWAQTTEAYYDKLLAEHGATPASIDATREGQRMRFKILLDAIGDATSVLDVGCGYCAFLDYLAEHARFGVSYTGIDVSDAMIKAALDRRPTNRFEVRNLIEEPFDRKFDAVVASGVFQFNHGAEYVDAMIDAMWNATGLVLAFNMLSVYADVKTDGEAYCEPGRVLTYCQTLTPYVTLRHDYRSNDFTVVMYRERQET